jgi:hypothetical protein
MPRGKAAQQLHIPRQAVERILTQLSDSERPNARVIDSDRARTEAGVTASRFIVSMTRIEHFVRLLAGNYGIKVAWAENGGRDGSTIILPIGVLLANDFLSWQLLRAALAHEAGHIIYSPSEQEIADTLPEHDPIARRVFDAIEDARVTGGMVNTYPGVKYACQCLSGIMGQLFSDEAKSLPPADIAEGALRYLLTMDQVDSNDGYMGLGPSRDVLYDRLHSLKNERADGTIIEKIGGWALKWTSGVRLFDALSRISSTTTAQRWEDMVEAVEELKKILPPEAQQPQDDGDGEEGDNEQEGGGGGGGGGGQQGGQGEPGDDEQEQQGGGGKQEEETKEDGDGEGGDNGTQRREGPALCDPSGYFGDKQLTNAAHTARQNRGEYETDQIAAGDGAGIGQPPQILHPHVSERMRGEASAAKSRVKAALGSSTRTLGKRLRGLLQGTKLTRKLRGQEDGRLDSGALADLCRKDDSVPRIFTRQRNPRNEAWAVMLLVDVSGSMHGYADKYAHDAAEALASALTTGGIPFAIYAYQSGRLAILKPFPEERYNGDRLGYIGAHADGGTPTGEAIAIGLAHIAGRTEPGKLIITIEDGGAGDRVLVDSAATACTAMGVDLVSLGIAGNDVSSYAHEGITVPTLEDLPATLLGLLRRKLKFSRKF